jgi:hypothetical protein
LNLLEAVAKWSWCEWNKKDNCYKEGKCPNYMLVDPRNDKTGFGNTGKRSLCNLLWDINQQIIDKTKDD